MRAVHMSDVPWVGLAFFGFVVLVVFLMRADSRRERALALKQQRALHRKANPPKKQAANDAHWREAYSLCKSPLQFEDWKAWMIERGYDPLSVIERSQVSNRKP